jgi:tetratricopeptide (TPR) repeat protein
VAILYPTLNRSETRHLLVLPFNCPGADAETDLLCAGLLDTVTAKLTEMQRFGSSLSVVPVSEVRGQRVISADMAHRIFGVDLVVTGSVLREETSIRIPIELVDAARLRQTRSRTITADNATDFVVQDRVVAALEEMLDLEFGAAERQALTVGGTSNAEAAGLFLEARGYAGKTPTEVHLTRAMSLYREALEIDPEYADAMVQLADACDQRYKLKEDSIWLEHGARYAERAVALAPELPAAQLAAGRFDLQDSLYESAIEHLQRAIALDPLGLDAYMYLAEAYELVGKPELADTAVERAIRTGPEDWQTYYDLGKFFYDRHDWERASGYFREVVRLLPESSVGYTGLGGALFFLGDREHAREALERGVAIGSGYEGYNNLATLEFYDGRFAEAARLYERALEMDDSDNMVWLGLAEARKFGGSTPEEVRDAYQQAADRASRRLEDDPENLGLLIDLAGLELQLDRRAVAEEIIDGLRLDEVTAPDKMFSVAEIFEVLGERDEALAWIERSLKAGFPLEVIEDYAAFTALCADPRFGLLAETYGESRSDDSVERSEEGEE